MKKALSESVSRDVNITKNDVFRSATSIKSIYRMRSIGKIKNIHLNEVTIKDDFMEAIINGTLNMKV